tara:strand:- start:325 stop:1371 length:1047 start_codon:yes stop_codon:yes gene_type:complete
MINLNKLFRKKSRKKNNQTPVKNIPPPDEKNDEPEIIDKPEIIDESETEESISDDEIEELQLNIDVDLENCDDISKDLLHKYFNNPYITNSKFTGHEVDKDFIRNCIKWSLNRKLNALHWNKIYTCYKDEIIETKKLIITNPFMISYYNNNFLVLDGQHRIKALEKLMNEYNFDCKIRIDLYITNDYKENINILRSINTTNPLKVNDDIQLMLNDILTHMKQNYRLNEKTNIFTRKKAQRPKINEIKFIDKLRESKYISTHSSSKYICSLIDKCNKKYSKMDMIQLVNKFGKKISNNMLMNAINYDCFLGFDYKFEWIDDIDNQLEKMLNKKRDKLRKKNSIIMNKDI